MSKAKKCDRCGKLYECSSCDGGTEATLAISNGGTRNVIFYCSSYSDLDLCSDCLDSFIHWWNNETVIPITKKRGKKNDT